MSFTITDGQGNELMVYRTGTKVVVGDQVTVTGKTNLYNQVIQIAQGSTTVIDVAHVCTNYTTGTCTQDSVCVVCAAVAEKAPGHLYENGVCTACGAPAPVGTVLPEDLIFTDAANKASGDTYMNTNFPEWKITGKLGQTYGGYLGFGRSGDTASSITSSTISTTEGFTLKAILKGNGTNGEVTSTLTFTLVDAAGNVVAYGYAEGSETAAIVPVDAKDTNYVISFVFVEGKDWSDVSNLVITFAKSVGNIGLKALTFVQ